MGMVRAHSGDAGVAQTLALAGERRSFTELADPARWSSLAQTVALLNAAALVTGDGAIGLHVGEVLLFTPEGTTFGNRLRELGSITRVLQHIEPVIDHFETTSSAGAIEVASDHALVEVVPKHHQARHAHLCELTRGLLAQIPVLFDLEAALITETECAARGGKRCLYALSWDSGSQVPRSTTARSRPPRPAPVPAACRRPRARRDQRRRTGPELQHRWDRGPLGPVGRRTAGAAGPDERAGGRGLRHLGRAPGRRRRVAAHPDRRPRRRCRVAPTGIC